MAVIDWWNGPLCVVLAAAYLKYRRCRWSCLPFVWHFFSLWHTHTHISTDLQVEQESLRFWHWRVRVNNFKPCPKDVLRPIVLWLTMVGAGLLGRLVAAACTAFRVLSSSASLSLNWASWPAMSATRFSLASWLIRMEFSCRHKKIAQEQYETLIMKGSPLATMCNGCQSMYMCAHTWCLSGLGQLLINMYWTTTEFWQSKFSLNFWRTFVSVAISFPYTKSSES